MKKIYWLLVFTILISNFNIVNTKADARNDLIVKLQSGVTLEQFLFANNLSEADVVLGRDGFLKIRQNNELASITSNSAYDGVDYIESDIEATILDTTPNDPYFGSTGDSQWGMKKIGMMQVWDKYHGDKNVVVAVLDTGFNRNHEDLQNIIWQNTDEVSGNGIDDDGNGYIDDVNGWNFVKSNGETKDDNDHGSAVSSVIVSNTNNNVGLAGVNWQASIMPVKVADASGSASLFDIAQGIYYAVDNGAKVINMSLGAKVDKSYLRDAVQYAYDKGVFMVAAAGNSEYASPDAKYLYYPANYERVTAVGATDKYDKVATLANASFISHYGKNLDLVAPGVDILGAASGKSSDPYLVYSGTSLSSPHVAGAAAMMLSKNNKLSVSDIYDYLVSTADKPEEMKGNFDERYGYGRLNVARAMDRISGGNVDPDPDPITYGSFNAQWVAQSNYWNMRNGELRNVWLDVKNTGTADWQVTGKQALHLATCRVNDRSSVFYDPQTWLSNNRIQMTNSDRVKPGQVAHFSFNIKAPVTELINSNEYFCLVAENQTWLNDMGIYWNINVANSDIDSAVWKGQSDYVTINVGQSSESWVEFINNGTTAWRKDGVNAIHLGTSNPLDRNSDFFVESDWLTSNRIEMDQTMVLPGEIGRFTFQIKANRGGLYQEYFRPVIENKSWLQDCGLFWRYNVN